MAVFLILTYKDNCWNLMEETGTLLPQRAIA